MSIPEKYIELNAEQWEAVSKVEGPVLVFAGAGTGKTKTLTSRIAYMIEELGVDPSSILAITFTKKAANEMRERIHKTVGVKAKKIAIMTIHAFCARILRKTINILGFKNDFDIVDDDDSLKIISDSYKELNLDRKYISPKHAQTHISAFKNGMLKKFQAPIDRIYESYQKKLKDDNLVDFDDLLVYSLQIIKENPEVCNYFQDLYHYFLVDEFQDTNLIQYELIKCLGTRSQNIFVVGDDDQSIYSFRGACVENLVSFKKDFPTCQTVKLLTNYRSSNAILKGANNVIKNNFNREEKALRGVIEGDFNDVIVNEGYYYEDEVRYIINEIKALSKDGYSYEDIAILYRNNVLARNFELALIENKIPYSIYGGFSYLKRKEVKDCIAYLKFILDTNSLVHFRRVVNTPSRGIGDKTLEKIEELIKDKGLTLFSAIDYLNECNPSSKTVVLVEFKKMILELVSLVDTMPLIEFFDELLAKSGYLEALLADGDSEKNRLDNVKEFKSILYNLKERDELAEFTNSQLLRNSFDELVLDDSVGPKDNRKGITLSTIHSAKGLEFDVVFVVALEEGLFPAMREEADIEEERRVAYVAFTRAKKKIYLSCATRRLIYGRIVRNQKSRFLTEYISSKELDEHLIEEQRKKAISIEELKVGDYIFHCNFGEGQIIKMDETTIQVLFIKDNSLRLLMKNHPAISPL